jgi:muramoyltetrapeptide carboxypeptidase
VLVLEEVGEEVYRLDRLLTHLRMSGALDKVAAICLGRLDPPKTRRKFPPDRPLEAVVRETLLPLGVPVVVDLPFGHVPRKRTLPLGGRAILDTVTRTLRLSTRPVP